MYDLGGILKMNKESLKRRIQVANKEILADLVIKNGNILDIFNLELMSGDIAIVDGVIAGIGTYEGKQEVDVQQRIIVPGLIDAHVHIESSMITPEEFAKVLLPHGVTTVITDPHEIANVAGEDGISFMIADSEDLDLNVYIMLPSSVPATPFENAGAVLHDQQLAPFYQHSRVLGLAEVMDYPGVKNLDDHIIDKLVTASRFNIDGHGAGLDTHGVNVYATAGIKTDHECITIAEAKERLSRGMYLMIRQGSVAKNLPELIHIVNEKNSHRCLFCTDDKHLDDLIAEGSIDFNIRLAIQHGLDPLLAIQLATINTANCFGLSQKGAIAPGYDADFLIIDDLQSFQIQQVYTAGRLVAEQGVYLEKTRVIKDRTPLPHSVRIRDISAEDLAIAIPPEKKVHVIEIIPNQIETIKQVIEVPNDGQYFISSVTEDLLKVAVLERHNGTGNIGLGIVKGLGLIDGAIATTVAHDSHNLIVAGTNDEDMLVAIQTIKQLGGGLVVVRHGVVLASLQLAIGGLMSNKDYQEVAHELNILHEALQQVSKYDHFNLFLTLSFLSLPVIPELKITDMGLFDVATFKHIRI